MISQEQATEYMQVAALVCQEIDILEEIAYGDPTITLEQLKKQIRFTKRRKDGFISDKAERERVYKAACELWSLVTNTRKV